ncbi:MAG: pyrroline-5-carboxylate reductase [Candidatus Omnitrophica bacterium]|jgi:pyrroline-5-carboxylate reductase|nr:pyrroline-5-carboxylate reductase [Candidatus Omnitrophota bacterium]
MNRKVKIGIVGFGHIGEVLAISLAKEQKFIVSAYDKDRQKQKKISKTFKVKIAKDVETLVNFNDVVILAVKPQDLLNFLKTSRHIFLTTRPLIISIAAGFPLNLLQKHLFKTRLIRVMPNLAAKVKESISFICGNNYATKKDLLLAKSIFSSVGEVFLVKEYLMNKLTGLAGSGPGYIFYFMNAIYKAALVLGFPNKTAQNITKQIFRGAVKLGETSAKDFEILLEEVASRGGTTEAALQVFQKNKLDQIIIKGVKKASHRAEEISQTYR